VYLLLKRNEWFSVRSLCQVSQVSQEWEAISFSFSGRMSSKWSIACSISMRIGIMCLTRCPSSCPSLLFFYVSLQLLLLYFSAFKNDSIWPSDRSPRDFLLFPLTSQMEEDRIIMLSSHKEWGQGNCDSDKGITETTGKEKRKLFVVLVLYKLLKIPLRSCHSYCTPFLI